MSAAVFGGVAVALAGLLSARAAGTRTRPGGDPCVPREIRVRVAPKLTLSGRCWGPKDGRPVLALHGWLDNASSFDLVAPVLAKHGYRVVALDLAGHGLSDHRPPSAFYHLIDYVADVCYAADELGWDKFSILGHSLGGSVGCFVAATWPDRVECVALVETLGPWTTPADKIPKQLAKSLTQRSHRPQRVHASLEAAAVANSKGFLKTPLAATRVMVARGTRPATAPGGGRGYVWRADARLREVSRQPMTTDTVRAFATAVRCPVLVVTAVDGIYAKRDQEEVQRRLSYYKRLTHVVLSEGGHHCHLVQPQPVNERLLEFFARCHGQA